MKLKSHQFEENSLIFRLLKRAEIRRTISTRKSVLENKPDKIADLLEEAAKRLCYLEIKDRIRNEISGVQKTLSEVFPE